MLIQHSKADAPETITPEFMAKVAVTHLAREIEVMRKVKYMEELRGTGERAPSDAPSAPVSLPVGIQAYKREGAHIGDGGPNDKPANNS